MYNVRVGRPDIPFDIHGMVAPFVSITPAMSKCAHGMSSGTKAERNAAAEADPPARPPVLFRSALCVGDIESKHTFYKYFILFE